MSDFVFLFRSSEDDYREHGFIDEYRLIVTPVTLSGGTPWLRGVSKRIRLELLEAKACPSGNVMLRYARSA
jgi:hypothetical protein